MAIDADFYDNLQWDPEDAEILRKRGQLPLVYNEIAPMVDWVIGTERRARVDWHVLPRAEDDVALADTKSKVLMYVADLNRVQFVRSRAYADAIKVGVGWLDGRARRPDRRRPVQPLRGLAQRPVGLGRLRARPFRRLLRLSLAVGRRGCALTMFPQRCSQIAKVVEEVRLSVALAGIGALEGLDDHVGPGAS